MKALVIIGSSTPKALTLSGGLLDTTTFKGSNPYNIRFVLNQIFNHCQNHSDESWTVNTEGRFTVDHVDENTASMSIGDIIILTSDEGLTCQHWVVTGPGFVQLPIDPVVGYRI